MKEYPDLESMRLEYVKTLQEYLERICMDVESVKRKAVRLSHLPRKSKYR